MKRKDGGDHKHEWEQRQQTRGDLVDVFHYCPLCGLRSRKGRTQHPVYQPTKTYHVADEGILA